MYQRTKKTIVTGLFAINSLLVFSLNYTAYKANTAPVIDGLATDSCWLSANWNYINNNWKLDTGTIANADFSGKFKTTWTANRLYILAEITDDTLRDDNENPVVNYWEDDCFEIFIDENHKVDKHECKAEAYNAFAYHIAAYPRLANGLKTTFGNEMAIHNVIDYGKVCKGQLFNKHVNTRVSKNGNVYTWEVEIIIYNDTYKDNAENIPVELVNNKVMGFAIAYCDNDSGKRDDFIGTEPNHNDFESATPCFKSTLNFGSLTLSNIALD